MPPAKDVTFAGYLVPGNSRPNMLHCLICMAGAGLFGLPMDFSNGPPEGLPPLLRYEPILFPEELRLTSIADGYAEMLFTIEPGGKVLDAIALEASHPAFESTVRNGLLKWRFAPAPGNTVPRRELIHFDFRRHGLVESMSQRDASKNAFIDPSIIQPAIRTVDWESMERKPERTNSVMPSYPQGLRDQSPRGFAVVNCVIDATGAIRVPVVTDTSDAHFGEEALKAIRQWRFEAPTHEGRAVNVRMTRSFNFGPRK